MRFRKGTKVEVWTLKEGPSGSWRCAEIIGRNSHHYTVRYEGDIALFGKATVESVSQKAVRPCPPPVDLLEDWTLGDLVEVLHNSSWKMATVLKVSRRNHVFVRLLGSGVELKANKYDVRARLCWQDEKWFFGKASNKCEDLKFRIPSSRNDDELTRKSYIVPRSQAVPLKRKLYPVCSQVEAYGGPSQKKIRLGNQFNAIQQSQLPGKVENIASSREVMHEKCAHRSLTDGVEYSRSISVELNDDVSVSSSVGSYRVYRNSSYKSRHIYVKDEFEDNDSQFSDAESCSDMRPKEGKHILPTKEVLKEEIHRLELHAYRCTIGALYESGPLSWEQEMLLTNLRGSLHISNDEHLREIKKLVSSSMCIPTS